jgi:NAD dependent epimerase/dehydratase family enzyme
MSKKVVIAGGTGFIGNYLSQRFKDDGYEVVIISRQKNHVQWQNAEGIMAALEGAEMLINLAGKPINTRFTEQNKAELIGSRVHTTELLGKLRKSAAPLALWCI